jgi:hypothetical protein
MDKDLLRENSHERKRGLSWGRLGKAVSHRSDRERAGRVGVCVYRTRSQTGRLSSKQSQLSGDSAVSRVDLPLWPAMHLLTASRAL